LIDTSSSSDSESSPLSQPPTQVANSVSADNMQLEILKLLKELKSDLKYTNRRSRHTPNSGPYTKTPDDQTKPKR